MTHTTTSLDKLKERVFYPDLIASMEGFMQHMHNKGQCSLGKEITEQFAAGYIAAPDFDFTQYQPCAEDPLFELKSNFMAALSEIYQRFHDRLPRQFYATLAFLGTREDPTVEERIPDLEHLLPDGMNWQIADSMLHALGVCYRLSNDVQTTINRHTGRVLGHGCACSCQMQKLDECIIRAAMGDKPECVAEETEAFLRHGLGQNFLLHFGLPQEMGESVRIKQRDLNRIAARTADQFTLHQAHNVLA